MSWELFRSSTPPPPPHPVSRPILGGALSLRCRAASRALAFVGGMAAAQGWIVAVLRHRGWGDLVTTPKVFDGCSLDDLTMLMKDIQDKYCSSLDLCWA